MKRIAPIAIVVLLLVFAIAYSQFRGPVDRVSGFIEADEIRVGSRIGGRVEAVHVKEGERVEKGQVLVELEPFDLLQREQQARETLAARDAEYRHVVAGLREEEIAQARARHEQFKARFDLLEAGPRQQEVEAASMRLAVAEAELTLAEQNYKRSTELIQTQAISRVEFDTVSERRDAARALVGVRAKELELLELGAREEERREARARVVEAEQAWQLARKGSREEEIERAKASRDAAQAALDTIVAQRKELIISCPLDGVVEALDLQVGDMVPAGAPVLSIMDDSQLWVRAYVPQNRVGLQVGQTLGVVVDSFSQEPFAGEITFISRQAEFTPSNVQTVEERSKQVFRIKVGLTGDTSRLRPGMTADVLLESAKP